METSYRGVKEAFDAAAQDYDGVRRQLIPCFDDFYGMVGKQIPFGPDDIGDALDLGAGTGLLAAILREQFPKARFTLIDISEEMLARARERFAGQDVSIVTGDYSKEAIPGWFDAIVSALSIHHLTDDDKAALFRRIFQALKPGGVFVNADEVKGDTPELDRTYWEEWEREILARGIDPGEVTAARTRMSHDIPATLEAHLHWLRKAGFVDVDCWYKYWGYAVFGGRKHA
jgi:tRNA (cmo5U34)-methyltransferase